VEKVVGVPRNLNSVARVALRRVPSMLRQDSRVKLRRHSLVASPRPDSSEKRDSPQKCSVPKILVHQATITREESLESNQGRQSLSREDTMESLLSSPDLDSAI